MTRMLTLFIAASSVCLACTLTHAQPTKTAADLPRQHDGGHTDAPNIKDFLQWVDNWREAEPWPWHDDDF